MFVKILLMFIIGFLMIKIVAYCFICIRVLLTDGCIRVLLTVGNYYSD